MKKILSVFLLLIMVFSIAACGNDNEEVDVDNPINLTMEVSILVDDAIDDGFESFSGKFIAEEDSCVLDASQLYCIGNDISVSINEKQGYITEIMGLTEKDYTDTTGWLFYVNGETPAVSSSEVILKDGDIIKWEFVDYAELDW